MGSAKRKDVGEVARQALRESHRPECNYPTHRIGAGGCICVVENKHELEQLKAEIDAAAARSAAQERAARERIETVFCEGERAAALAHESTPQPCPYPDGSQDQHWWTRGYAYVQRLLRAVTAEGQRKAICTAIERVSGATCPDAASAIAEIERLGRK